MRRISQSLRNSIISMYQIERKTYYQISSLLSVSHGTIASTIKDYRVHPEHYTLSAPDPERQLIPTDHIPIQSTALVAGRPLTYSELLTIAGQYVQDPANSPMARAKVLETLLKYTRRDGYDDDPDRDSVIRDLDILIGEG